MRLLRRVGVTALVTVSLAGAATPAFALHKSVSQGSSAWTSTNHYTVFVSDDASDSHSAYGKFWHDVTDDAIRVNNENGAGTTVTKDLTTTINYAQACVNVQLAPDWCGSVN